MRTTAFRQVTRALRLLAAAALADVVAHPSGVPGCPYSNRPYFFMPGQNYTDPNPPRCVAMALERLLNYVLVGRGARVVMIAPDVEFGDWGGALHLPTAYHPRAPGVEGGGVGGSDSPDAQEPTAGASAQEARSPLRKQPSQMRPRPPRRGVDMDLPAYLQALYPEVWGTVSSSSTLVGDGVAGSGGLLFDWPARDSEPPPAPYLLHL